MILKEEEEVFRNEFQFLRGMLLLYAVMVKC